MKKAGKINIKIRLATKPKTEATQALDLKAYISIKIEESKSF